jgi:DNA-binding cell septation regulator SpoVG
MVHNPFDKYKVMNKPVIVYDVKYNTRGGKTAADLVINLFGLIVHRTQITSGTRNQLSVQFPLYKTPDGQYEELFQIEDSSINRKVRKAILRQYYARMRDDGKISPFDPVFAEYASEGNDE